MRVVLRGCLLTLAGAAIGGLIGGYGFATYEIPPEDKTYRNVGIAFYGALGAIAGAIVVGGIVLAVALDRRHEERRRQSR
jgi:hypothetical protein